MSRILVLAINHTPELTGCGRYTGELCADLVRSGHDVTVVTAPPHYPAWRIQPGWTNAYSRREQDGAHVYRCPLLLLSPMRGIRRALAPLSFALSSMPVVLWQMIRRRPDAILIVQPTFLAIPAALALSKLLGVRTCLHVQDLEIDAAFAAGHIRGNAVVASMLRRLEARCLRAFDVVVTISNAMSEQIVRKGVDRRRVALVRNWVDAEQPFPDEASKAMRAHLRLPAEDFILLYAGAMGPKQGLDIVVEAARRLSGEPRLTFVLAGDGASRAGLEEAAAGLDNLRFLPVQPAETFAAVLAMCDAHILPQIASAADLVLPSKLGGMLASGRPIVATAAAGTELADILKDAATIVEPGNAEALVAAIVAERAGEDPARRERRIAIAKSWSRDVATRRIEDLLLNKDASRPPRSERPSVSVVMPFYNSAATLEAALRSVARQTWPVSEIILVDDGSRVEEADSARRIVEAFPGARIVACERNAGPSAARNRGIREAKGSYVALLDADDRWLPHKMETCLAEMQRRDLDFLGHATSLHGVPAVTVSDRLRASRLYEMKTLDLFVSTSQFAPSTIVFRKNALPVEFAESLHRSEDYRLWGELLFRGFRLWRLKDALSERDGPHIGGRGLSGDIAATLAAHLSTVDHFRAAGFIGGLSHRFMRLFLQARFLRHG